MPLQRRLPKVGFSSRKADTRAEVRLHELEFVQQEIIDLASLKAANIVPQKTRRAKIIASGKLTKAVKIRGIMVTKGARIAIEAAQGSIED
jgi:large subunit ribosomal protein L15